MKVKNDLILIAQQNQSYSHTGSKSIKNKQSLSGTPTLNLETITKPFKSSNWICLIFAGEDLNPVKQISCI